MNKARGGDGIPVELFQIPGREEQAAQMAWGWRGRNSLSPTNGLWVFIALGTICELKPPYFLHS